jgi:hypothetical protein
VNTSIKWGLALSVLLALLDIVGLIGLGLQSVRGRFRPVLPEAW